MKLERIHIERYGAWQSLDLPVDDASLSVFFGPNEAGKTTLMRFIRGVLYGFDSEDLRRLKNPEDNAPWGGSLQIQHENESWLVRRIGKAGTRGLVTACRIERDGEGPLTDGSSLVRDLVGNVSEKLYENVFAIGLPELQTLASLEAQEVAEHIYSVSMGLEGRRLLRLIDETRQKRSAILDIEHGTGTLTQKHAYLEALDRQLEGGHETRRRYGKLSDDRRRLEDSIIDAKDRQRGLEEQLRGHEYMDLVWEPWRKVQKLEHELAKLPANLDFPKNGLASLKQIESELATHQSRRSALHSEAKASRDKRRQIEIDPNLRRYAPTMQSLVDQREWIAEIIQFAQDAVKEAGTLKVQLEERLQALDGNWTVERLRTLDVEHLGTNCLHERAREFSRSDQRNRWVRQRYRKLHSKCHRRQKLLIERKEQLGVESITEAVLKTQEQLSHIKELGELRVREAELVEHKARLDEQLGRLSVDPSLPQWVYVIFSGLGLVGGVLGIGGLSLGLQSNFIAGMGYFMLGLCCEGLTWSLKKHFEGEVANTVARMKRELTDIDRRLETTRLRNDEICELIFGPKPVMKPPVVPVVPISATFHALSIDLPANYAKGDAHAENPATTTLTKPAQEKEPNHDTETFVLSKFQRSMTDIELMQCCHERLHQLEQLQRLDNWVTHARQALITKRVRLHDAQREFGTARQQWVNHVQSQGLTETVNIDAALGERDALGRAAMLLRQIDDLVADANLGKKLFQKYRAKIEDLGHSALRWKRDYSNPLVILDEWKRELTAMADKLTERRRLRSEYRAKRVQAAGLWPKIRRLKIQQSALLVRGGAASIDDFQERAANIERRVGLEDQITQARRELERVASTNQAVAIVESDLRDFDRNRNQHAINTIQQELEDIAAEIESAHEQLTRTKQELKIVESDSSSAELRFEREQLLSEITELTEDWFAFEWALQTLDALRLEFERNHQTPILSRAREILWRLSAGRYTNVWTPLGERGLCVETSASESVRVENLSSGAQEQLFLAIRLALIEHFSKAGIDLPVVLDDILVNFDQERTRSAVDELFRLANDDQQILFFTCHQHLAEMFRQRGIGTVMLPAREVPERLAG